MNYANIKTYSIENGTGVRVSLFVSGCTHHCKGCFNEEAWDFSYGKPFTKETEDEIIHDLEPDYMAGITLLGGEPMEPVNQRVLVNLLKRIRKELRQRGMAEARPSGAGVVGLSGAERRLAGGIGAKKVNAALIQAAFQESGNA